VFDGRIYYVKILCFGGFGASLIKNLKNFTKKLIVLAKNDDNNIGYPVMQTESGFFCLLLWGMNKCGVGRR
jgi:hypothetical protein